VPIRCNDCEFLAERFYDREFQIWVRPEADGLVSIGMTDISQTIAGKLLNVRVRRPGTTRPAGRPVATIESGKWAGPVPNFFDCAITHANTAVLDTPHLVNIDPYGAWIARVRPVAPLEQALAVLVSGDAAEAAFRARCERDSIHCKRIAP
jgi:glycine cleavage system H protein